MINKKLMTRALVLGTAVAMSGSTIAGVVPFVETGMVALAGDIHGVITGDIITDDQLDDDAVINKTIHITDTGSLNIGDKTLTIKSGGSLVVDAGGVLENAGGTIVIEEGGVLDLSPLASIGDIDISDVLENSGKIKFPAGVTVAEIKGLGIKNSGDADVTVGGTSIMAKVTTAPQPIANLVYTADPQYLFTAATSADGDIYYDENPDFSAGTQNVPEAMDAKEYTFYYMIEGDANHLDSAPVEIKNTIAKRELTVINVKIVDKDYDEKINAEFDGSESVEFATGGLQKSEKLVNSNFETLKATFASPNAGKDVPVNVELALRSSGPAKNYTLKSGTFTSKAEIRKATATVSAPIAAPALTYSGADQVLIIAGTTDLGVMEYSVDAGATWSTDLPTGKDASTYNVWYRVEGGDNFTGEAMTGPISPKPEIEKVPDGIGQVKSVITNLRNDTGATATINLPSIPEGASYGAITDNSTPENIFKIDETNKENGVLVLTGGSAITGVTGTKSFKVTVTAGTNYEAYEIEVHVMLSEKYTQTITSKDNIEVTYGDADFSLTTKAGVQVTAEQGGLKGEISYTPEATGAVTVDAAGQVKVIEVGQKEVTVNAAETDDDSPLFGCAEASKAIWIKVNPKDLTIVPGNIVAYVGDEIPELTDEAVFTYNTTGFKSGDKWEEVNKPRFKYERTPNMTEPGVYNIVVDSWGKIADGKTDNYNQIYKKGTLTIMERPAPDPGDVVKVTLAPIGDKIFYVGNDYEIKANAKVTGDYDKLVYQWTIDGEVRPNDTEYLPITVVRVGEHVLTCQAFAFKNGVQVGKSDIVTFHVSARYSGGGSGGGSTGGGSSSSGGSAGGSLSRPPVTTQNGGNTNNNQNTNNDTPTGSNVPVSQYAHANAGKALPIIRMYNPVSGEHILTTDANEAATLEAQHGWTREATTGTSSNANNSPVYRLLHPATGKHIYTMDPNEVRVLTTQQGWTSDGVVFFAGGSKIKMYRLYNPNLPAAVAHHYTTDPNEYETLQTQGWTGEGVAFTLD